MKKPDWKKTASLALLLVMLGLLAAYVYNNRADMERLLRLDAATVALLVALAVGSALVNCVYHLVILRTYGLPLDLTDWMGVVSVSNVIAYVLPLRADLVFSAAYYKRVKGLAYTKSVSMAAGNVVFGVAFSLLQILVALLFLGFLKGQWPPVLWALWGLGTAALAAFTALALWAPGKNPKILQKYRLLGEVAQGFTALLRNRAMLWRLLGCLVANNIFQLLLYQLCFASIGHPVTLYEALFYNSVSWLSSIVAIVPGNIGIKEGVMGLSTLLMGISVPTGVAASLLQRVALMAAHLLLGAAFAWPVYRRFRRGTEPRQGPSGSPAAPAP
ncbi:MAG: lysylphosphatidylglycerol synthase transmembrane domain-containing protein [Candidatus Limiplasma sp.]|nr:lysylphosphatidylglycerol synthase transmembrane domain-containing protein [Candidatus Limiplasma sp.]